MVLEIPYRSVAAPSRAVDWGAFSFQFPADACLNDLLGFAYHWADQAMPNEDFSAPKGSLHYGWKRLHPGGIGISATPLESAAGEFAPRSTSGRCQIEFTGRFWGSVTGLKRQTLLRDVMRFPGFTKCNRLDVQVTLLNPAITAKDFARAVEDGQLWPVGARSFRILAERDPRSQIIKPPTSYFGSQKSSKQVRVYDKGAESGWDVSALRVEGQFRDEMAISHFLSLARACEDEPFPEEALVTAESNMVGGILKKEFDLRDCTPWDAWERPHNWAQFSESPDWWLDAVQSPVRPDRVTYLPPVDLERTWAVCVEQYGRKLALELARRMGVNGTSFEQLALQLLTDIARRAVKGDGPALAALVDPEQREEVEEAFQQVLRRGGKARFEMPPESW